MAGESPLAEQQASETPPLLTRKLAERATVLGMCVRNALEGTIHGGELGDLSLTDEQMAILNPVVRNAIASGLHAMEYYFTDRAARAYLDFQARLVPPYWEPATLLDDYVELWPFYASRPSEPAIECRHCLRTVVNVGTEQAPYWKHIANDRDLIVGCRAASFTSGSGWDDDIPRSWRAAPTR